MKKLSNTIGLFMCVLVVLISACSKNPADPAPIPVPPPVNVIDTARVRLKQIEIPNLPSPYFEFVYNDSGYATHINFASNFFKYELEYNNKRISRMTNQINGDKLVYQYQNGNVSAIDQYSGITGFRLWHYEFAYDVMQKLVNVKWYVFPSNGSDSLLEKVADLKYGADGNLSEYKYSIRMDDGSMQWGSTYTFSNYDKKINVDDFGMLKQFFDHLLYLPAVKFQTNNPASSKISSTVNEFEINYQYQYQGNLPQAKTTTIRQTKGSDAGRVTTSTTQYSYY